MYLFIISLYCTLQETLMRMHSHRNELQDSQTCRTLALSAHARTRAKSGDMSCARARAPTMSASGAHICTHIVAHINAIYGW